MLIQLQNVSFDTHKIYPKLINNLKNYFSAVCDSIMHPVYKLNLLEYIAKYRFRDDSMPPPEPHHSHHRSHYHQ